MADLRAGKGRAIEPVPIPSNLSELKIAQKKYANDSNNGVYVPHVYHVFNDSDFQEDVAKMREKFEKLYFPGVSLTTEPSDEYLLAEDRQLLKELADKYCITYEDLGFYADGLYDAGESYFGRRPREFGGLNFNFPHEPYSLAYIIGTNTTLEDIKRDWPEIKFRMHMFSKNPDRLGFGRTKSPENTELIYAVFKARCAGKKYSQIFKDYQNQELENYKGSSNQYTSEESLERYYRKYQPMPQQLRIYDWHYELEVNHRKIMDDEIVEPDS